jgi:hypothetical protein
MFNGTDFIMKQAYLSDFFEKMNTVNTSLQGSECNIHQINGKLKLFIKIYELWQRKLECGIVDMFLSLKQFINNNYTQIIGDVKIYILSHICSLKSHLENYFLDLEVNNYYWIRNPNSAQPKESILTINGG